MSVSLWRWSERCEGKPCCGDCDECALEDEEEKYVLTPWGCLYSVLMDHGVDVERIPGRVGVHIVEDFMDAMMRAGYVGKAEATDGEDLS